jgi:hypothetical protein
MHLQMYECLVTCLDTCLVACLVTCLVTSLVTAPDAGPTAAVPRRRPPPQCSSLLRTSVTWTPSTSSCCARTSRPWPSTETRTRRSAAALWTPSGQVRVAGWWREGGVRVSSKLLMCARAASCWRGAASCWRGAASCWRGAASCWRGAAAEQGKGCAVLCKWRLGSRACSGWLSGA